MENNSSGLNQGSAELNVLANAQANQDNGMEVSIKELLSDKFLKKHTPFTNFDDFGHAIGMDLTDVALLDEQKLDSFIQAHTDFSTWSAFVGAAADQLPKTIL